MLSFWERQEFIEYDYLVIGSGIVGLSTAIELKKKNKKASVLVLEKGLLPTGASTKNAGFACFGSLTELIVDLEKLGPEKMLELVEMRWKGLELLISRLGKEKIDYQNHGGYELLNEEQLIHLDQIEQVNDYLTPLFTKPVFRLDRTQQFGFNQNVVKEVVFNPLEGQIDTGKMMKALIELCGQLGVQIITGAEVTNLETLQSSVEVQTLNGLSFSAQKVAVCTNAFTNKLLPNIELEPGRGVVLVTKPISDLNIKGTFHYDEGYFYFRNFQDRIIFGGGRNLFYEQEKTSHFSEPENVKNKLVSDLEQIILPNTPFEVDQFWSGVMAFGPNKWPILEKVDDRVFAAVRLGGMGVAIGSKIGADLAGKMSNQ